MTHMTHIYIQLQSETVKTIHMTIMTHDTCKYNRDCKRIGKIIFSGRKMPDSTWESDRTHMNNVSGFFTHTHTHISSTGQQKGDQISTTTKHCQVKSRVSVQSTHDNISNTIKYIQVNLLCSCHINGKPDYNFSRTTNHRKVKFYASKKTKQQNKMKSRNNFRKNVARLALSM